MEIDKEAFRFAVSKIADGFIFESFGQSFLSAVLGYNFIPVGGSKDKGIDGFEHVYCRNGYEKAIYQFSTELNYSDKIKDTIEKLNKNKIKFDNLIYVTNRDINNIDIIIDDLYNKYKLPIRIFDLKWFVGYCLFSEQVATVYNTFVQSYLHEYNRPGKTFEVANFSTDSRLYVFLRQQFDSKRDDLILDEILADTLILFSLEGTDPDQQIFKTETEIIETIKDFVKFDPTILLEIIQKRLKVLSTKPRKISYHPKNEGYCLPYETRLIIQTRNLQDSNLCDIFNEQTEKLIKKYMHDNGVSVKDLGKLISKTIHDIYYQQGLEFSNFIINGDSKSVIEQDLQEVINTVVDNSSVVIKNKEKVKACLLMAIREIVYNGTIEQKKYLKSLSNTYMMMFMLQWEPKLSMYFQSMASKMKIFVDNSIIIPALSEYYLKEENQRHWNLLKGAKKAGISLFINETLLEELVSHFKMINNKYFNFFYNRETFYMNDECETLFIDEIMIRAYFYAKMRGKVQHFDDFLDNFLDPSLKTAKKDLITLLKDEFGIEYISNEAWDIRIDENDKAKLTENLRGLKNYEIKAENDAEMILAIYYLREKFNETSESGIFGYRTWWLSKDTATYKAVIKAFGEDRFPISCYIRPDFIYNYIALTPHKEEVDEVYDKIFPSLLGVNLSYHMPKEISDTVQQKLKDFENKSDIRIKQIMINLSDRLKSDPSVRNRKAVSHYLDEELNKLKLIES